MNNEDAVKNINSHVKLYKVTKIADVEHPYHKNSDFGFSKEYHVGGYIKEPEIGERFNLTYIDRTFSGISTSPVAKIIDDKTFETLNSVYSYVPYE